jgi:hypothetical protein
MRVLALQILLIWMSFEVMMSFEVARARDSSGYPTAAWMCAVGRGVVADSPVADCLPVPVGRRLARPSPQKKIEKSLVHNC